jgi:hypothetical protein
MTKDDEERPVAPGATGATYNEPDLAEELEDPARAPGEDDGEDADAS